MATTKFRFQADENLTVTLYFSMGTGSGTPAASYSTTEILPGLYEADVMEALQGKGFYYADDASSNLVANGLFELRDDVNIYYGFDPVGHRGYPDLSIGFNDIGPSQQLMPPRGTPYRTVGTGTQVITTGTVTSGTVASTQAPDFGYHITEDVGGAIDMYYEFNVGSTGLASGISLEFYCSPIPTSYLIYLYDWNALGWTLVGRVYGDNDIKHQQETFYAAVVHTGTGADVGKVRLRIQNSGTASVFGVDFASCHYFDLRDDMTRHGYSTTRAGYLDNLASGGAGLNDIPWNNDWNGPFSRAVPVAFPGQLAVPDSATVTTGVPTGSVANVGTDNGPTSNYSVAESGGEVDFYFEWTLDPVDVVPTQVQWKGNLIGDGGCRLYYYDWVATSFVQLHELSGASSPGLFQRIVYPIPSEAVSDTGVVRIRFENDEDLTVTTEYITIGYLTDPSVVEEIRAGVNNLSTGSAAISTTATGFVLTTGSVATGSVTDTTAADLVYHEVNDAAGAMEAYYEFDVGPNGVPVSVSWTGLPQSGNDDWDVFFYNWGTTTWEQVGEIQGGGGGSYRTETFTATVAHVGTGANEGLVRWRFTNQNTHTSSRFRTDRVVVNYTILNAALGYENGKVWCDEVAGTSTGTVPGVDGLVTNRSDDFDNAQAVATALGYTAIDVKKGNSITLTATINGFSIGAADSTHSINLGGQNVSNCSFLGGEISGTGTGTNVRFIGDIINTATVPPGKFDEAAVVGPVTLGAAGDYIWRDCVSGIAGPSSPIINMPGSGTTNLSVRNWAGGFDLRNLTVGDTVTLDGTFGTITIAGTGGVVEIRGTYKQIVDNSGGSVTVGNLGGWSPETARTIDTTTQATNTVVDTINTYLTDNLGTNGANLTDQPWNFDWNMPVSQYSTSAFGKNRVASGFTKTVGGTETNTFEATQYEDAVLHVVPPNVTLDVYYEFEIDGVTVDNQEDYTIVSCYWLGSVAEDGDEVKVFFYDWDNLQWVRVGQVAGRTTGGNWKYRWAAPANAVSTSGQVRVRFLSDGGLVATQLSTNHILVEYQEPVDGGLTAQQDADLTVAKDQATIAATNTQR